MTRKTIKHVQIDDQKGILYSGEKESLLIPVTFIKTVDDLLKNLVGEEGARLLIYKIGESLGKSYVQSLEKILKKENITLNKKTKLKIACNAIFMESGWGTVKVCSLDIKKNNAEIIVTNAPSKRTIKGTKYGFERGILSGVYEEITNKKVFYSIKEQKGKTATFKMEKTEEKTTEEGKLSLLNRKELHEKIKQATEEITAEKEKVSSVLNSLFDGLIIVDQKNRIMMINPQAQKWLQLDDDDIGKNINNLDTPIFENLTKKLKKNKKLTSISEEASIDFEMQKLFLNITTKPVISAEKEIIGHMMVIQDVTRFKILERLKNEFISVSAHQLRTPLSAIKWSLGIILNGELGNVKSDVREYLEKSYLSNERMIVLVNDLLNVSRIEEGRFVYRTELVLLDNIINDAIFSLSTLASKRNIKISFNKKKDIDTRIKIDSSKIRLAIQNILKNAIEYSDINSNVTINLKQKKEKNKKFILIEIIDHGLGIKDKEQEKVFEKFFRGEKAVKMQTEGSGLGLFITKNIVNAHHGKLWFESREGVGSTFYVKLPI